MSPDLPQPPSTPAPREETHLYDYLGVILRRRTTFALAFLAVFLGVALYTFTMKPVYEASATLHVKEEKGKGGLMDELSLNMYNPINAELEILKSRTNAEQVVKRLHLDWQIEKKSEGLTFRLLDFSSTAEEPLYHVELTGAGAFTVKDNDGNLVGRGQTGLLMQGKGVTFLLDKLNGWTGDRFRLALLPFNDTVEALQEEIKATEVKRATNIILVSYSSTDPVQARDVVNTLVQVYLEQAVGFRTEEASRAAGFVEGQLQGLHGELDSSEKNLQLYKSSSGVIKLDSEAEELIRKVSETEKGRAEVTLQKKQVEFALTALKDAAWKGTAYSPSVLRDDPLVAGLAAKLSELEVQKRALLTEYTEAHPAVKAAQEQIEEVQKKIQSTYETSLNNIAKRERDITQQLAGYEQGLRNLPEAERDLARLTRISKVNADIYTFLLQKREEARIAKASTISNINIVDPAITPGRPVKPQKSKNLLLGFLVACMLGVGLVFFREYMDDTIKDAEVAKQVMGIPLLAVIPFIPTRVAAEGDNKRDSVSLFTQLEPKSHVAEAFRSLRTSLHFSAVNRDKKILLITSTFPKEGKTVISANLANILSQTGARVLIVDCDLRRSFLHEVFGHSKSPGLTELLAGNTTFLEVRHNTGISGIDLISAGTTPPNPAELLGSEAMRRFLLTQRENYDHIVIDAPPVLAVTDAPVLTAVADMVLVVMEVGRVPVKAAQHVRELLAAVQAPTTGLVINNRTSQAESYGYYGGRYYRYGNGYHYGYGYGYDYYSDEIPMPTKQKPWRRKFFRKEKTEAGEN